MSEFLALKLLGLRRSELVRGSGLVVFLYRIRGTCNGLKIKNVN